METDQPTYKKQNQEIDLFEVCRSLWSGRKVILGTTAVFLAMGVLYILYKAYYVQKEYQSTSILLIKSVQLPENSVILSDKNSYPEGNNDNFSQPIIDPKLIPIVFENKQFLEKLLTLPLLFPDDAKPITLQYYLNKKTKPAQGNSTSIAQRLTATIGVANTIEIACTMADPAVVEQVLDSIPDYLNNYLQEMHAQQAGKRIKQLEKQCKEAEKEYLALETELMKHKLKDSTIFLDQKRASIAGACELAGKVYRVLLSRLEDEKVDSIDKPLFVEVIRPATEAHLISVPNILKVIVIVLFGGLISGSIIHYLKSL